MSEAMVCHFIPALRRHETIFISLRSSDVIVFLMATSLVIMGCRKHHQYNIPLFCWCQPHHAKYFAFFLRLFPCCWYTIDARREQHLAHLNKDFGEAFSSLLRAHISGKISNAGIARFNMWEVNATCSFFTMKKEVNRQWQ